MRCPCSQLVGPSHPGISLGSGRVIHNHQASPPGALSISSHVGCMVPWDRDIPMGPMEG